MKPLKTFHCLLTWLCMCAADKSASVRMRILYIGVVSMIFALNLFCLVSNLIFFIKFFSTDLKGALFAFMSIYGNFAILWTLINAFRARHKINEIFESLSVICSGSKSMCSMWNQKKIRQSETFKIIFLCFQMTTSCQTNFCQQQMIVVNGCGTFTFGIWSVRSLVQHWYQ